MNNIDAVVRMSGLTVVPEKAGDEDGPIGLSIRFSDDMSPEAASGLFSTPNSYKAVLEDLWTRGGELATSDVKEIDLDREIKDTPVTLVREEEGANDDPIDFDMARISKISLVPKSGRQLEVSFQVYVVPTKEQIGEVAWLLRKPVRVTAVRRQQDLPLDQAA